jgi:hypothetical protein
MQLLLLLCLLAQWDGTSRGITVHVEFESGAALGPLHYSAEISSGNGSLPGRSVAIEDGTVEFEDVSPGVNTLRVRDRSGATIMVQPFQADRGMGPLRVAVPASEPERPPSGTVSLYRMEHPLSRKTLREMREAVKYLTAKDDERAMEHLDKALATEPHLPEAHSWRGALYLRKGDLTRASEEMQTAWQQGLRDASLYVNLGVLQVMKRDLPGAAQYAEEAIRLQPSNQQAQRLLSRLRAMPR